MDELGAPKFTLSTIFPAVPLTSTAVTRSTWTRRPFGGAQSCLQDVVAVSGRVMTSAVVFSMSEWSLIVADKMDLTQYTATSSPSFLSYSVASP